MRAINAVYNAVAVAESKGLYIYMPFSVKNELCEIKSLFPNCGGAEIIPASDTKIYIRVPHWTVKKDAELIINGEKTEINWDKNYAVADVKAGDVIKITWSLVKFTHISQVWSDSAPDLKVEFAWLGNSVTGCNPPPIEGKLPLFHENPRVIPKFEQ
jgi:hypothetical protein